MVVELNARSLDRAFTYSVPDRLRDSLHVGSYVRAPFGKQTVYGYVVGLSDEAPDFATKAIIEKAADEDPLGEGQVALARWLAKRYHSTFAEALRCFLPPGAKRKAERIITLTPAGREAGAERAVSAAPNQLVMLQALRRQDGVDVRKLSGVFGRGKGASAKVSAAVRALIEKGLASEARRLGRPAAAPLTRQVARLADLDRDWLAVIEELSSRAPRQAEVVAALVAADGEPVLVAELSRDATRALAKQGLVEVYQQRVERTPEDWGLEGEAVDFLELNPAQSAVLEQVREALSEGGAAGFLIHGVTGSGKTEVYLHSIDAALRAGRSAIVLVPEIALTPQAVGRFKARFGDRLALLHSALSSGERFDEWERIRRGEADIVVGARSAVFAPCKDLGIIVVDEEHERAYKQDSEPRYAAQVVAAERARREGAVLLLGSATPGIESYYEAECTMDGDGGLTPSVPLSFACDAQERGRNGDGNGASPPRSPLPDTRSEYLLGRGGGTAQGLVLASLPERIDNRPLPPVEIVDLRKEPLDGQGGTFSEALLEALQEGVAAGEQSILFLNRRGFSTFVMCRECGFSLRCPDCAVSLTYHHRTRRLRCHHCEYERAVPDQCENCEGYDVGFHGSGTERVADQVERQVEGAVVARMDRDTTSSKGAYGEILRRFGRGEANILVGTQMIAKGHDFPNVTLVGVLNADTGLNWPDFRAAEHTFQVLTQVSGRAGRHAKPGRVIVQTYNPDHYAIVAAAHHDYLDFYQRELASRRANRYPPFASLVKIGFSDEEEDAALAVARRAAVALESLGVLNKRGDVQYLGPAEAPLHKLRRRYRYHILLKGPEPEGLLEVLDGMLESLEDTGETSVTVDVDPMDMM